MSRSPKALARPTVRIASILLAAAIWCSPSDAQEGKVAVALPARLREIKAVEQHASYWSSEPGWDTELQLRNNLPAEPLTVTPVLRLPSGQEIALTAVTIPANASVSVSVNEGLQEHAPGLLGQAGSYGSVVFRFQSHNAMNLYATTVPSMRGVPVAFRIPTHPAWNATDDPLRSNGPGSLEGIWWKARTGLRDWLVIGNSSDAEISGTLSLFDASGKRWSEALSLNPHQMERMAVDDLLQRAGLKGNYGGISFEVPASASALDAVHLMYDEGGKFSASLDMFHRDPNATVRERTGSDKEPWTMRAPMLALTAPDPALGLSPEKTLQPTILMRNTTGHDISANITLSWRSDSRKGVAKLPVLQVAPFATQQLEIWERQKQLGIPADAHWALVSLTTNAAPDDLIAIASSRDCTGEYSAETKFVGGGGGRFAGGEWRLDATHNQLAAVTNVGTQPTDALLTLHYDKGVGKYELQQSIPPGEQMWVNLGQLARQRIPDRKGNFLPVDVSAVTYDLQDLTPGGHSLMANDLTVNTASGQAVPNCPECCAYYNSPFFAPDPVEIIIDGFQNLGINGVYGCNHSIVSITSDFTTWSSSNTSIAQVTTAQAQGVAVGTATGFAQGDVLGPGQCACNFVLRQIDVPIYVKPVITSISPNLLNAGDVGKSVTIHGAGFGPSPKVNLPSGVNTNNQQSSTDNTIVLPNVGVAATTYIGPSSITVTAAGQTSAPSPFTIDGPDHMIVKNDQILTCSGCNSTVERDITYQVIKFSGSPVYVIPIGENFSESGWNCNQKDPGSHVTLCAAGHDTSTAGTFTDGWSLNSDGFTPVTCGSNIIDHWQWCTAPKTIGTLSGYCHENAISINGSVRPPGPPMANGTIINP